MPAGCNQSLGRTVSSRRGGKREGEVRGPGGNARFRELSHDRKSRYCRPDCTGSAEAQEELWPNSTFQLIFAESRDYHTLGLRETRLLVTTLAFAPTPVRPTIPSQSRDEGHHESLSASNTFSGAYQHSSSVELTTCYQQPLSNPGHIS